MKKKVALAMGIIMMLIGSTGISAALSNIQEKYYSENEQENFNDGGVNHITKTILKRYTGYFIIDKKDHTVYHNEKTHRTVGVIVERNVYTDVKISGFCKDGSIEPSSLWSEWIDCTNSWVTIEANLFFCDIEETDDTIEIYFYPWFFGINGLIIDISY